jgi:hypothetical protein
VEAGAGSQALGLAEAIEILLLSQSGQLDLLLQERSFHVLALMVRYGEGRSDARLHENDVWIPAGGLAGPCPAAALERARVALSACQRQVLLTHAGLQN